MKKRKKLPGFSYSKNHHLLIIIFLLGHFIQHIPFISEECFCCTVWSITSFFYENSSVKKLPTKSHFLTSKKGEPQTPNECFNQQTVIKISPLEKIFFLENLFFGILELCFVCFMDKEKLILRQF